MKAITLTAALIITACTAVSRVSAQDSSGYRQNAGYAVRPTGNGISAVYHHASTFEEGFLRGQADLLRAWGDFFYSRSLAMINHEEARRRYIQNRVLGTEAYFSMRETNRQARAAERGPRATQEDVQRFSQMRAPKRLEAHQFDSAFGVLHWPEALQDAQFAQQRTAIDRLMATRTVTDSGAGSESCRQIETLAAQLKGELKDNIDGISPSQYVAAKQFLDSLAREAQQVAAIEGLAAR
jgi:hypothetical protein